MNTNDPVQMSLSRKNKENSMSVTSSQNVPAAQTEGTCEHKQTLKYLENVKIKGRFEENSS